MEFKPGDRVQYDDATGEVTERIPSERGDWDDYMVRWDATGEESIAWGSDLVMEGQR